MLTYVSNGNMSQIIYFGEILIASLGLLLVPKNIEINISDLVGKTKFLPEAPNRMLEQSEATIYKLNSVSETIDEVAKSYKEVAATTVEENEVTENREIFIDELLNNIESIPNNILYEDVINEENGIAQDIFYCISEKNTFAMQDLIDIFEKHNNYIIANDGETNHIQNDIMDIVKIVNQTYKISKLNFVWKQKMDESKKAISNQLDGVSKVISKVAKDLENTENQSFEEKKYEIETLFIQKNIKAYDILISKKTGRTIVSLVLKNENDVGEQVKEIQKIESILSKVLEVDMQLQNQKRTKQDDIIQIYTSSDKYNITVGKARIAKDRLSINGDSLLEDKLEDGKLLLAISDGMGTGKNANKSSRFVIDMLQKLLSAGAEKEETLKVINSSMLTISQKEEYATLDMCVFDLFNGNVEIIKNGACPTYIKNGKNVEKIEAKCLPAGVTNSIDTVTFDKDLKDGDIIIMLTDGIIDANKEAANKQQAILDLIAGLNTRESSKNSRYNFARGNRF